MHNNKKMTSQNKREAIELLGRVFLDEDVPLSKLLKNDIDEFYSNDPGLSFKKGFRWALSIIKYLFFKNSFDIKIFNTNEEYLNRKILLCSSARREGMNNIFNKISLDAKAKVTCCVTGPNLHSYGASLCYRFRRRAFPNFRIIVNIFRLKGISITTKIELIKRFSIEAQSFFAWKLHLSKEKYSIALFDMDNSSINLPIVLACKKNLIKTVTFIHGCTWPADNFIPFCADFVFIWGNFHVRQFKQSASNTFTKLISVGNPNIKAPREIQLSNKSLKIKMVGLVTGAWEKSLQKEVINTFSLGVVVEFHKLFKQHPRELAPLNIIKTDSNVTMYPKDGDLNKFLAELDVLCVRESSVGLEALPYGVPIIVIDCNHGKFLGSGELLNIYAGCPIVQNSKELQTELSRLQHEEGYLNQRLLKQYSFMDDLFSNFGEDSLQRILNEIFPLASTLD